MSDNQAYDPMALTIAEETIQAELSKRRQRFAEEIGRAKAVHAKSGTLFSGGMLEGLADVCANEIESSSARVWEVVHRTLVTTGVQPSDELGVKLKRQIEELLRIYCLLSRSVCSLKRVND